MSFVCPKAISHIVALVFKKNDFCKSLALSLNCPENILSLFLALVIWATLFPSTLVLAESKHVFPNMDERDFVDYVKQDTEETDGQIHIFSSFSVLGVQKENIVFSITQKPHPDMIPLIEIKSYPVMQEDIRSEFFDFTLWGQMENYFSKDLEVIQQENRIFAILKELDAVNAKYLEMSKNRPDLFNASYTVTLDQHNYFTYSYQSKDRSNGQRKKVKQASANPSLKKRGRFDGETDADPTSRRLKTHVLPQREISREQVNSESAKAFTLSTRPMVLSPGVKQESTWITGLFKSFAKMYDYFLQNKIISIIVLTLLLLLLKVIIKVVFLVFIRV